MESDCGLQYPLALTLTGFFYQRPQMRETMLLLPALLLPLPTVCNVSIFTYKSLSSSNKQTKIKQTNKNQTNKQIKNKQRKGAQKRSKDSNHSLTISLRYNIKVIWLKSIPQQKRLKTQDLMPHLHFGHIYLSVTLRRKIAKRCYCH